MSESSSDTESSCGWTLISNEGSDIETLGPEKGLECGTDLPESAPMLGPELHDQPASLTAERSEERGDSSHDTTLKEEETLEETLAASEAGAEVAGDEHVTLCSSSDHSDIVTLGDVTEADSGAWEEQAEAEEEGKAPACEELYLGTSSSSQELYLGTSSSSQYTFSTAETVFPLEQPVVSDSSSSEDEAVGQVTPVVRRRRVRRSTTSSAAEPEEEARESGHSEREEEEVQQEVQQEVQEEVQWEPHAPRPSGRASGTLNKCILLALVIAISMGFGHFYGRMEGRVWTEGLKRLEGTVQIQEKQKGVEKIRVTELGDSGELPHHQCPKAQTEELVVQLKQTAEERTEMESQQKHLAVENQLLKSSLEREEESLSTLLEELRNLRSQIRDLEEQGAGADSILSENQRLKDHLEEEKERVRSSLNQRETLMAEAQTLRKELDKERKVTDQLREELDLLSSGSGEADPETEELQSRLMELEKKLSFEQQRSDLWERLYVETKEDRANDDKQAKVKKPKSGVIGKVKETFDAMKNSTKEFVHHHKEQIKKAKEAVKENLRKFSDSVKSTFRHFKDSASRMMDKARRPHERRYNERKDAKAEHHGEQREDGQKYSGDESWQHRTQEPLHRHPHKSTDDSFQDSQSTSNVQEDSDQETQRGVPKGCTGVFDCAYQESMSLFNKALDPIRADEFRQLLHRYLQQEVDHFHHWTELESFINNFFHNGIFIHDQMLFTDFVSGVEDYLEDMDEYHSHDDDVFEDLDEYVYRHFFGDTYSKRFGPSRPFEGPSMHTKEQRPANRQQRKEQRHRPRPQRDRKWSRSGRYTDRHMADVKIELGPLPFDPKY